MKAQERDLPATVVLARNITDLPARLLLDVQKLISGVMIALLQVARDTQIKQCDNLGGEHMGRDIRVESKHLVYRGSKSSDLMMAFDLFFSHFPRRNIKDGVFYSVNLSKKEMKQVIDFVSENIASKSKLYKDASMLEKLTNIYIRMMPDELVEVTVW